MISAGLTSATARSVGALLGKPPLGKTKTRNPRPPRPEPGSFLSAKFSCPEGGLDYRLYTPKGSGLRRMPLVVMLHGCSQTAADFAAGTGMNRLADELGFLVLYPQQSRNAHFGRCWNWHDPAHQQRGSGEPAVIAALTRHAIAAGRVNPARVYIAGISAGGAAAAIIGAAYPDLFVAVGVHSGVAAGHVSGMTDALSAMRGKKAAGHGAGGGAKRPQPLPTIVFHGDSDKVVHPVNTSGFLANLERAQSGPLLVQTRQGRSGTGHRPGRDFTRRIYQTRNGKVMLEEWVIHGEGHAWSGGRAAGSFTDPEGPDASRAMAQFFLARRR